MAQHDYVIANGTGAAVRSDLNNALAAIVTQNSGATAPATTYAYQWWADTTTGLLKIRNAANNAWITLFQLDGEWSTLAVENGSAAAPSIYFKDSGTDTGIYSPGTDQVAISTGGSGNVFFRNGRIGVGESNPSGLIEWRSTNIGRLEADASTVTVNAASNAPLVFKQNDTERMRLTATGLGIGSTTVSGILDAETSSDTYINFSTTNSGAAAGLCLLAGTSNQEFIGYRNQLRFGTITGKNAASFSERCRLDSSGRLLVGTSTALAAGGSLTPVFQIAGGDQNSCTQMIRGGGSLNPTLVFARSNGSLASPTAVVNNNGVGGITFEGYDGTNMVRAAIIAAEVDGTPGTNDMPGKLVFSTTADGASSPTERMRIMNNGRLLVGTTASGTYPSVLEVLGSNVYSAAFYNGSGHLLQLWGTASATTGWSGVDTVTYLGKHSGNSRSINAAGTINASGADYAEYMTKAGSFTVAKGEICGVAANGLLTLNYADAVSFVVKSTNPSYVGGDTWGTEDVIGPKPDAENADALAQWEADLEAARQKVDRIAFAGQVPVNVLGATPGQYIVPVEAADGGIEGIAKNEADLTLAEYMRAVGKVIAIEDDGRARIIVKVA